VSASAGYDVVIAGGGPGGAICAARLAQLGHKVVVFEKARFPRFHLGESLLPQSVPVFQEVGVLEKIESRFIVKRGAHFHDSLTGRTSRYAFEDAFDKRVGSAFQVPRDEFDQLLLEHAAECGAEVRHEWTVLRVLTEERGENGHRRTFACGFEVKAPDGHVETIPARFVVDATGRDALTAHASRTTQKVPRLDQTALYSHFRGAFRDEGDREGDIQIVVFDPGWFWFIPFKDGRTSVGAVVKPEWIRERKAEGQTKLEDLFWAAISESPVAVRFLAGAQQMWPVEAAANFSYRVRDLVGDGWLVVGDAGGFLDPLFSTGAHLAMFGGVRGATAIHAALEAGNVGRERFAEWEALVRKGASLFLGAVQAFYEGKLQPYLFADKPHPFMRHAITSMLSGDVFEGDDRWQREMRARFPAVWTTES
jgi:flavin-dependent dehydrogenase